MPPNMAMEGPGTWIVGIVLDCDVAEGREVLSIATLRVGWIGDGYTVPLAGAGVQDIHVVAMEMHGVR